MTKKEAIYSIRIGKILNSKDLKDVSKGLFETSVNVDNALCYFEGSRVFNLPGLKVSALKCICRWFCYLVANKKYFHLSLESGLGIPRPVP